jgi:VanZ family protein
LRLFQSAYQFVVRYHKLLSTLLVLGITVLSLIPLPQLPEVPGKDKTMHMVAYAVLAFPVALARPKGYLLILLGFALWSGVIELVQPLVNRHMSGLDFAANTLGLVVGLILAGLIDLMLSRKA